MYVLTRRACCGNNNGRIHTRHPRTVVLPYSEIDIPKYVSNVIVIVYWNYICEIH